MAGFKRIHCYLFILTLSLLTNALASKRGSLSPALRGNGAEPQSKSIRGLLYHDKRQYTCYNWVRCGARHCCPSSAYSCCSTGDCCDPGFYCDMGDNGIMGCCENGIICTGSAPPPITTRNTYTSTRTRTVINTPKPIVTTAVPPPPSPTLPPPSPTFVTSSAPLAISSDAPNSVPTQSLLPTQATPSTTIPTSESLSTLPTGTSTLRLPITGHGQQSIALNKRDAGVLALLVTTVMIFA